MSSPEIEQLHHMARMEARQAWAHAKAIPGCLGDVTSAVAKRHPLLTMGGVAALTAALLTRHKRRGSLEETSTSLPMAAAMLGVQFLPDLLRIAGLSAIADDEKQARNGHEPCDPPHDELADSALRGTEAPYPSSGIQP